MKRKCRILITGSNGFVGKHLVEYLKKKKNYLILTDNKNKYNLSILYDFKKLLKSVNPNIIIHLAARTVTNFKSVKENKLQFKNTFKPVVNLLKNIDNCKNLEKIIFTGSIEEYGNTRTPFKEVYKEKPFSSYGKYKLKSFKYVQNNLKNKKIKYIWLRPSLIFGPNDNKQRFLGSIFNAAKKETVCNLNLGNQIRDYLFINDFNRFIYNYLIKKNFLNLNLLNITNENWISLKFILKQLNVLTKGKIKKYLNVIKTRNNSKLINSGKLFKKKYPKFYFTNFRIALERTIKSYDIK